MTDFPGDLQLHSMLHQTTTHQADQAPVGHAAHAAGPAVVHAGHVVVERSPVPRQGSPPLYSLTLGHLNMGATAGAGADNLVLAGPLGPLAAELAAREGGQQTHSR